MPQYSIHKNNNPNTKKLYPYLMNVQSSLLDVLDTRLVIPLTAKESFGGKPITQLNPVMEIEGIAYIIQTQQMAAVHVTNLGTPVGDASLRRNDILSSIDFLITGF